MILSNLLWMFILNECSNYSLSIPAWCPITNEPYFPDLVEGICFLVSPLCLRVKQRVSCKWCFKLDLVDIPCFLMIDPRNKSLQFWSSHDYPMILHSFLLVGGLTYILCSTIDTGWGYPMMSIFSDWLKSPISIVYIIYIYIYTYIYIDSFFEHRLSMGTPFHHWFNTRIFPVLDGHRFRSLPNFQTNPRHIVWCKPLPIVNVPSSYIHIYIIIHIYIYIHTYI